MSAERLTETPERPAWLLLTCPDCGRELVTVNRYVEPRGYLVQVRCPEPDCSYHRTLF